MNGERIGRPGAFEPRNRCEITWAASLSTRVAVEAVRVHGRWFVGLIVDGAAVPFDWAEHPRLVH